MQFRLEKYWLKKIFRLYLFCYLFSCFDQSSNATLKITPVEPYKKDSSDVAYYAAKNANFMDVGFHEFDLTTLQGLDVNRTDILFFDVSTDTLSGSNLVINIKTQTNSSQSSPLIPIAMAGGSNCGNGNCVGQTTGNINYSNYGYFFAATYTAKQTLRIGIYPFDICIAVVNQDLHPLANGCSQYGNSAIVTAPIDGTPTRFILTFNAGNSTGDGKPDIKDSAETASITLNFQSKASSFTCPSLDSVYFPGDSQISIDTSLFTTTQTTGNATIDTLVVAGKDAGSNDDVALVTTQDFATSNDIVARLKIGSSQKVDGFKNSTDTETHNYTLAFTVRDKAGVLYKYDALSPFPSSCKITKVQTSEVLGFLSKSNCFIATSAFRSASTLPVLILQEFRDRILLPSSLGQSFVKTYYKYSPKMATWLVKHPDFRFPVLLILVPVEFFAWLMLNPLILFILFFGEITLFYFL
ncbi:MAG: hypothetical protein HY843_06255, partial [Bdellovibrio sp.]|nr:hypothetical protein [Bdellovibrio sp.]